MAQLKKLLENLTNPDALETIVRRRAPHPQEAQLLSKGTPSQETEIQSQTLALRGLHRNLEIKTLLEPGSDDNETRLEYLILENTSTEKKYHGTYTAPELLKILK